MERRTCGRKDHLSVTAQWHALLRHQYPNVVERGCCRWLLGPHLDDVQTGVGATRACLQGEKGSLVVYANSITRKETDDQTGEEIDHEIHFMKGYTVFNVEQIEGLPDHYYAKPEPRFSAIQRIEYAETFFANLRADIRHGGTQAYYAQEHDYIRMPPFEAFTDAGSYYATLAHESTHWTKHPSRLAREFGRKKRGDEGYAEEELRPSWARPFCPPISNCP